MDIKKIFLITTHAIAIVLLVIGFRIYQIKQAENQNNLWGSILAQQTGLQIAKNQIEILKKELEKAGIATAQRFAAESAARLAAEAQLKEVAEKSKPVDTTAVINEWKPRIASVQCNFLNTMGVPYYGTSASGILTKSANGSPIIVTNRHVVNDPDGFSPTECYIKVPGQSETFTADSGNFFFFSANDAYDRAYIKIDNPNQTLRNISASDLRICLSEAATGSSVVMLGYPRIGAQSDVTATEGIISGFDGEYYITSAKVERGNSGGAAILLKDNCYLGMPTFAKAGAIESLARILKATIIFDRLLP